jgi:hypothetical protein
MLKRAFLAIPTAIAALGAAANAAPPSCVTVEATGAQTKYVIVNGCHGNGYALVRTTNESRRAECDVVRISTNRAMAPEVYSYFSQRPVVLDACGDTPSCRRELQERKSSC